MRFKKKHLERTSEEYTIFIEHNKKIVEFKASIVERDGRKEIRVYQVFVEDKLAGEELKEATEIIKKEFNMN